MRSRTQIQMLCCLLWSSSLVQADEPKPAEPVASLGTARDVECEADDRVVELLHTRIRAEWSNVPLTEVLKSISSQHQIEIWIDHQELKGANISIDHMVDMHLGEVSIWQALHFLMPRDRLGWTTSLGRLVITTGELATYGARTRIYDVKKIVDTLEPDLRNMRGRNFPLSTYFGAQGYGLFNITEAPVLLSFLGEPGPSLSKEDYGVVVDPNRNIVESRLTQLFAAMWFDGYLQDDISLEAGERRLVVRVSRRRHFQIQGMLQTLEVFIAKPANVDQFRVRRPHYPHAEDALIFQALSRVREFDGENRSLHDVLNNLAKAEGIRLYINQLSLSEARISLDAPVKLRTSKLPLSTILHRLLDPLNIAFTVEEGVLNITTTDELEKSVDVSLYDVKNIPDADDPVKFLKVLDGVLQRSTQQIEKEVVFMFSPHCLVIQASAERQAEYEALLNQWRSPKGDAVKPLEPQLETRTYPVFDSMSAEDLINAVPDLVAGWDPKQKPRRLGHALVIKQSPIVHEHLEQLFGLFKTWQQLAPSLNPTPAKP